MSKFIQKEATLSRINLKKERNFSRLREFYLRMKEIGRKCNNKMRMDQVHNNNNNHHR
jgi:hypothetical protein